MVIGRSFDAPLRWGMIVVVVEVKANLVHEDFFLSYGFATHMLGVYPLPCPNDIYTMRVIRRHLRPDLEG